MTEEEANPKIQHIVPGCDAHVCHNCVLEFGDDKGKHPVWYMAKVLCPICGGALREAEAIEEADYPVKCDCGYRGFRYDCSRGECPACGDRVRREKFERRNDG